jgi:hypothetical protein
MHFDGIPRYANAPQYLGRSWPDPQVISLVENEESGTTKVKPSDEDIAAICKAIRDAIIAQKKQGAPPLLPSPPTLP